MNVAAQSRPSWWLWPTIVSIDAPAVAVLWQALVSRSAGAPVRPAEAFVLGCSVWLAYCTDRWLEACRLDPSEMRTHRLRFHHDHRWALAALWACLFAVDVAAAFRCLLPSQLRAGVILMAAVAVYLFSHQQLHRRSPWRIPKEVCVALLLGIGSVLFAAERPGTDLRRAAAPLGLFMALCFSNCALISLWEDEVDLSHGQTSLALQLRGAAILCRGLPWAIAAAGAGTLALGPPSCAPEAACAAASGILLGAVDLAEPRIGRATARVLADVALMTPAAWLALR
ncbi:MAG TPA: hypothetical protein VGG34_06290 [Opitutaceae bacterium]